MDTMFALKESAPELHILQPISPGQPVTAREESNENIPIGSTFDHTHNGVMRVFDPANGHQILWANDQEANQFRFPEGTLFPASGMHAVSAPISFIDTSVNYTATVYPLAQLDDYLSVMNARNTNPLMTISEDAWYDEQTPATPQTSPQVICIDGKCSVGATSRG